MPLRDEFDANNPFQIEITKDGSPTLRLRDSSGLGESMHNLKGAFSETIYIYLPTLQTAFQWQEPETRLLSVGLGLGYNELLTAAYSLKNFPNHPWRLLSYETKDFLRSNFMSWLDGIPRTTQTDSELFGVYDVILDLVSREMNVPQAAVRNQLKKMAATKTWIICETLRPSEDPPFRAHGIFYDAFSSQTSPELWNESNLDQFFIRFADFPCVLSTYAATGSLKRALKKADFKVEFIPGFGGKRQSTTAVRDRRC
ncbi:MAG: hypothetical protein IPJ71_14005 [Bdellovibrionales bacterium]|nr:hypothetical protein [Bdellovibrionales bacterium]